MEKEWISVKEKLPEKKLHENYSDKVLLWYQGSEHTLEDYGIGYYHYNPPYAKPMFIDFKNYGRIPTHWANLIPPPKP